MLLKNIEQQCIYVLQFYFKYSLLLHATTSTTLELFKYSLISISIRLIDFLDFIFGATNNYYSL